MTRGGAGCSGSMPWSQFTGGMTQDAEKGRAGAGRGAVAGVGGDRCDRQSVARDACREVPVVVPRACQDDGRWRHFRPPKLWRSRTRSRHEPRKKSNGRDIEEYEDSKTPDDVLTLAWILTCPTTMHFVVGLYVYHIFLLIWLAGLYNLEHLLECDRQPTTWGAWPSSFSVTVRLQGVGCATPCARPGGGRRLPIILSGVLLPSVTESVPKDWSLV